MHVVNTLDDARAAIREFASGRATGSRSPLAGEPNRLSSDLVGGNKLTNYAQQMRKAPTPWERKLWGLLKGKRLEGYKFRQQAPIDHYIVDFVNYEKRVIVELDGSQHAASKRDQVRDAYLQAQGFIVLRFWNNEVDQNLEGLLTHILDVVKGAPHRNPQEDFDSPARGEWERGALPRSDSQVIELVSPPFAACHAGVNYYRHLLDQLKREFSGVDFTFTLCCGDDPAIAHDALRMCFTAIRCDCGQAQFAELTAIAQSCGARVHRA